MNAQKRNLLIAVMLTQSFAIGMSFGVFPIFLQPLEIAFDASRTQVSLGQILLMTAMSVGGILVGSALDKGYPRRIMLFGACLMTLAFAAAAAGPSFWQLGVVAFAVGLCVPAVGPLVGAGLVSRFFDADRGKALGIMSIGPPLGSGAFAALAGFLIPEFGWQMTFAVFAVLCGVVLVPTILWAIPVKFPELESKPSVEPATSMLDIVRMPVFFWTLLAYAFTIGTSTAWTVHFAAYLGTVGLSTGQQSMALALVFWMGIPGALLLGFLADKIKPATLFGVMIAVSGLILLGFSLNPPTAFIVATAALSGFVMGGAVPLYVMMLGQRIAPEQFGRAMGVSNLFLLPIMGGAVLAAATLYERNADYQSALWLLAFLLLLAILSLLRSNSLAEK